MAKEVVKAAIEIIMVAEMAIDVVAIVVTTTEDLMVKVDNPNKSKVNK
ncbi:MAG: hypothetical protein IIV54_04005 [Bacteroidaceae bacterium]|nr:hypothetical protein [Bacteroidaceae bacterium]